MSSVSLYDGWGLGGGWYPEAGQAAGTDVVTGTDVAGADAPPAVPAGTPNEGGTTGTGADSAAALEPNVVDETGALANDGGADTDTIVEPSPAAPAGKCPAGCAPDNVNAHGFPTVVPLTFPRLQVNNIRTDTAVLPWPAKYYGPG